MTRSRLLFPLAFAAALLLSAPALSVAQTAAKTTSSKAAKNALVDINTASKSDLTSISGIDDATAQKIIEARPYTRKRDLLTKKVLSQTTYSQIKDEIVAKKKK
jgi:DNA uptake protein ComE-like DNA-binding protein